MLELETTKSQKRQLWIYLLPVVGVIPSLWTLSRDSADSEHKKTSRISLILTIIWLSTYFSLWLGAAQTSDLLSFRLLYTNALITTSYFLICFGLMFQISQGKSPYFPLLNSLINASKPKE